MMDHKNVRVAIDIGGTFTDLASYDAKTKSVRFEKSLSTPLALQEAVLTCFTKGEIDVSRLEHFVHGSTVAINAVIQKNGSKTALITTKGFEHVYQVGRTNRPDTYNLFFEKTQPLIPANLCFPIKERMTAQGRVHLALSEAEVQRIIKIIKKENVESIAVCFLHAYANPKHEAMVGRALRKAFPKHFITLSHEILREYREFERTSTTVLNAYVGLQVTTYLKALEEPLRNQKFSGRFMIMQSNGGVMTSQRASKMPVAMMESGPAGGIIGAGELGKLIGEPDVIAFDMGGTTAKTCLVEQGLPKMTDQYYIGGYQNGHVMRLPVVDIIEVGAGGGSIAWIDEGGSLKVGPKSAGSKPGPACYDLGGEEPTVTDANLVTGRLNATRFLGGEFDLNFEKAYQAIENKVAKPLRMSVLDAALGILKLADVKMSFAVRAITMQRGYDPRKFAMVAFGGAGPLHAMAIARELHIPRVIIPPQPGHFSALGMLLTDIRQDFVQTHIQDFASLSAKSLEDLFAKLENEGRHNLVKEEHELDSIQLIRTLDLRYLGQEYTVRVNVPSELKSSKDLEFIRHKFDELYEVRYGHAASDQAAQMVNLRVTAIGPVSKPHFESLRDKRIPTLSLQKNRDIYFPRVGMLKCPVYQRAELVEGQEIKGPAVVEEYASTTVLFPEDKGKLNQYGCLVIENGSSEQAS